MAERQRHSDMVACGFHPSEQVLTLADFNIDLQPSGKPREDAIAARGNLKRWMSDEFKWLTLAGPPGTGKSHLLRGAVMQLFKHGDRPYYITGYDFDKRIKDFNRDDKLDPDDWVERLATGPTHLIVDDLGSGMKASDYNMSRLERLYDIRYSRRLPTATAFNLLPAELEDVVGMRVYSRLKDARLGRIVPMRCEDARPLLTSDEGNE